MSDVAEWIAGGPAHAPGEALTPSAVSVDDDGLVWVSSQDDARIVVPGLERRGAKSLDLEVPVDRAEAEGIWLPLIERLRVPIFKALRDAGQRPEQVNEVLLVGGATRMPCVAALATGIFGRLPSRSLPPDEAVAMGAAVQAALKSRDAAVGDMVVTDIAPFTMGISVVSGMNDRMVEGIFYVRFHGRNALGWRLNKMATQFDDDYSEDEMVQI